MHVEQFGPYLEHHVLPPFSVLEVLVTQSCPTLQPHGLWPTRLLCPWDSPGKNTGLGYHSLLQGGLPTQGLNPGLLHCRQIHSLLEVLSSPVQHRNTSLTWLTSEMSIQFFMHLSFFSFLFNILLHRSWFSLWHCFSSCRVVSQESCLRMVRRGHSCRVRALTMSTNIHHPALVKGLADADWE